MMGINNRGSGRMEFLAVALIIFSLALPSLVFAATSLEQSVDPGYPTPVNAGQSVTFTGSWLDEAARVLFCKESTCTNCWYSNQSSSWDVTNCWCYNFAFQVSPLNCTLPTNASFARDNRFYLRIYNSSQTTAGSGTINSGGSIESIFYVNHRPNATGVTVLPSTAYANSTLSCSYTYNDDGDAEDVAGAAFIWYLGNGTSFSAMPGEDSKNLSIFLNASQQVRCSVKVVDIYTFEASGYTNSSTLTISNFSYPNTPVLVSVADSSNETNATLVNSSVSFTVVWSTPNASLNSRAFICNDTSINASGCSGINYCNTSYSTSSPLGCSYVLTGSEAYNNTYYARVCADNGQCSISILGGNFFKYQDSISPSFNLSSISNFSLSSMYNFQIIVIDNYFINITSLALNITNGSMSSRYTYPNFTCSGTSTLQTCNITLNLTDNSYILNFTVSDENGNSMSSLAALIVDGTPGYIPFVEKGYYQNGSYYISNITTTMTLFANWSAVAGAGSGVSYYEYAIGTAQYPNPPYNSLRSWANSGNNTSTVDNLTLVHGSVYYYSVRAMTNSGAYTNITSSNGIIYNDVSAPVCAGNGSCISDDGSWNNTNTGLHFVMNFTATGSAITDYQFTIGNNTCFQPGYDSVRAVSNTTVNELTATGLSLRDNMTYFICARARSANDKWTDWFSSNGIRIDTVAPINGSVSYTNYNISTNTTTIFLNSGLDNLSGIGRVQLQFSEVVYNSGSGCTGFSAYVAYNSSLTPSSPIQVVSLKQGYCYKFRYLVTDNAGNTRIYYHPADIAFFIDNTPPLNFTSILNYGDFAMYDNNFVLEWANASDPESGISYFSYTLRDSFGGVLVDWTNTTDSFIVLNNVYYPNGTALEHEYSYYATVIAVNKVGSSTNSVSNSVIYFDTKVPAPAVVLSVEGDTNGTDGFLDLVNDGVTNVTALVDPFSMCVYSEYDIDYSELYGKPCATDGNVTECLINATEGIKTFYITCKDANGNSQSATENTAVIFVADWSGPVISSITPANNSLVAGQVTISANIVDGGIGNISSAWFNIVNLSGSIVYLGNLSSEGSNTYSAVWDSASFQQSTYSLVIYANDTLNHNSNSIQRFTLNRDLPYLELDLEAYSSAPNEEFNISIIAQVFANVSYRVTNLSGSLFANRTNTSTLASNRNFLEWLVSLNITNVTAWPDGQYNITVVAVNNQSANSTKKEVFKIDRVPPAFANPTNTSAFVIHNNDSLNLSVRWTDANNISNVSFETNALNGSLVNYTVPFMHVSGSTYSLFLSAGMLDNGQTIYWRSIAVDEAGLENSTPQYSFVVENRYPVANATLSVNASKNRQFTIGLKDIMSDADNDNLSFEYSGGSNIFIVAMNNITGVVTLNSTPNWTGSEIIIFNATDPFGGFNQTAINITVQNDAPRLMSNISSIRWLYNTNSPPIYLLSYFNDANGDELLFNATVSTASASAVINQTSGVAILVPSANWSGSGWIIFSATDVEGVVAYSNNITLAVYMSIYNSTVLNSTIDGVYYNNTFSNTITGIDNSLIVNSTIAGSVIINSTVYNCTIFNSTLTNVNVRDCYIDPSIIFHSSVTEGSQILNSNVSGSTIVNTTVNNSNVFNSTLYDTYVEMANISDDVIYSGKIRIFSGGFYDADMSGPAGLADLINYQPIASIATIQLGYAGKETTFTTNSYDRNINSTGGGALNDSMTYMWSYGDGTVQTTSSTAVVYVYSAPGTYLVTLTAIDRFGRNSSTAVSIEITAQSTGGGGGGGSRYEYAKSSRVTIVDLSSGYAEFMLSTVINFNNTAKFQFGSRFFQITAKGIGEGFASIGLDTTPVVVATIHDNETKEYDLDGDGVKDVSLTLQFTIARSKAYFILKLLRKEMPQPIIQQPVIVEPSTEQPVYIPPVQEPVLNQSPEQVPTETENELDVRKMTYWSFPLIIVIVLAGLVIYKRNALKKLFDQQKAVPAGISPQSGIYKEDEIDNYITQQVLIGANFSQVVASMEASGWQHREAYYRVAQYVAREGLKEGKAYDDIFESMKTHGWDEEIVVAILNEAMMH
jgi:hypothetical protein